MQTIKKWVLVTSYGVAFIASQCVYGNSKEVNHAQGQKFEILYHENIQEINLEPEPGNEPTWRCSIAASSWGFSLVLRPNERLIADLPHPKRKKLITTCKLYRGHVNGITDSWVRLSVTGKKWSGMIWDGEELYILDPIRSIQHELLNPPDPGVTGNVIYKSSDIVDLEGQTCGIDLSTSVNHPLFKYERLVDELHELISAEAIGADLNLDLAVVTDVEFSQIQEGIFGTPTAAAVAARVNVVDGIYSEQLGVQISLADITELSSNASVPSTNPNILLSQFGNFSASPGFNNPGAAHLFTGRNLDGNIVGIAYLNTLCSQRFGVGVNEIRGGGTSGALLVAHELAHNFGAPHDNQAGPCASTPGTFIMNPSLNGSDQFSPCSISQMQSIINNASCLSVIDTNEAPNITITSPQDGASFIGNTEINFVGTASDAEDGDLGNKISWSSDLDGSLGTGRTVSTILSEGTHFITARVTDSGGSMAADTIMLDIVQDSSGQIIFENHFDTSREEFLRKDDTFRNTNEPVYASGYFSANGGFAGGGLIATLGGVDNDDIKNMSSGWTRKFTLDAHTELVLSFRYKLKQTPNYETDEFSELLVSINGNLVRSDGNEAIATIRGDGDRGSEITTGWVFVELDLGRLKRGKHTVILGTFNNKKTYRNERTIAHFDDVVMRVK